LCGSYQRVLKIVSVIWGLVASSGYFIKNGTILGVEDTTIIIAILISIPTPIAVEYIELFAFGRNSVDEKEKSRTIHEVVV